MIFVLKYANRLQNVQIKMRNDESRVIEKLITTTDTTSMRAKIRVLL